MPATSINRKPDHYVGKPQALGSGRIRCAFHYLDEHGKRVTKYRYGPTKAKAKAAAAVALRQAKAGKLTPGAVTVERYVDRWIDDMAGTVTYATQRQRAGQMRTHVIPVAGGLDLKAFDTRKVSEVLRLAVSPEDSRKQPLSPESAKLLKAAITGMLYAAMADGLVGSNAATRAVVPKRMEPKPERMHVLTPAQAARIVSESTEDPYHALYVLNVTTGARVAELCALGWEDIDLDRGMVRIDKSYGVGPDGPMLKVPKTASSVRTINLTTEARAALSAARPAHGLGPVFVGPSGKRLHPRQAAARWKRMLTDLGLPVVRFHDGRHTVASLMLGSGAPLPMVQHLLGHSTPRQTLDTYAHLIPGQQAEAADIMERILRGE